MSKYLRATLGIAAMLIASTALARERSALDQWSDSRRIAAAMAGCGSGIGGRAS